MSEYTAEIVHIRPTSPEAREELLRIRPIMLADYDTHFEGKYSALLHELEDGSWIDIWTWESRELAEYALSHDELVPTFTRWRELIETISFDWARAL